jgi:two-component system chemotaxis sensor kinase CheA
MLPIVYLKDQLRLRNDEGDAPAGTVIVLRTDSRQEFGLVVDRVIDTEEIVVKPLPADFEAVKAFSGCTVMGDGEIALILDVRGVAEMSGVLTDGAPTEVEEQADANGEGDAPVSPLLIVRIGTDSQAAIALDRIERIEVFKRSAIEHAVGHAVVQYRDALLPLLDLASVVGIGGPNDDSDDLSVVVYADGLRTVGLVIHRVVDIVEERLRIFEVPDRVGVTGSTIVQGVVTDLLDVATLVDAMPASFSELVSEATQKDLIDA